MGTPVPRETLLKIRKLAQLPAELSKGERFEITRLTSLKTLCQNPAVAHQLVLHLARKTIEMVEQGKGHCNHTETPEGRAHHQLMIEALAGMNTWIKQPTEENRARLRDLFDRMTGEQNEFKPIPFGVVRSVKDWDLLLVEHAVHCLLAPNPEAGFWVYQMARDYAERYDSSQGTGLIRRSAPLVQDIVDFWIDFYSLDAATLASEKAPVKPPKTSAAAPAPSADKPSPKQKPHTFTHLQGQYLAFIHLYWRLHRRGPGELDMRKFFQVSPPSVHNMVVKLDELGLVTREPGVARSVRVAIPETAIPTLEATEGPPWE